MFACSLGAACGTIYLMKDAKNTPVKAAAFYGAPLNTYDGCRNFDIALNGLYNRVFGHAFISKSKQGLLQTFKYST